MTDTIFSCAHNPFVPAHTVSTSPLAPTPSPPGSCRLHPLSASSPGSCSLIQLGRCNLLKKKPIIWLITPLGDLARLGRRGWVLTAEGLGLHVPVSQDPTHSLWTPFRSQPSSKLGSPQLQLQREVLKQLGLTRVTCALGGSLVFPMPRSPHLTMDQGRRGPRSLQPAQLDFAAQVCSAPLTASGRPSFSWALGMEGVEHGSEGMGVLRASSGTGPPSASVRDPVDPGCTPGWGRKNGLLILGHLRAAASNLEGCTLHRGSHRGGWH